MPPKILFPHAANAKSIPISYLRDKGFTTLQLMPIDISSGPPGWSYDQTRTGAVDRQQYGGVDGLIDFVEAAHGRGLDVIIDKQYNHRGPEQDSRPAFIPGMFDRSTMWGPGLSGSEIPHYLQILKLIGEEMAYWVSQYGIDGFRLDATNRLPWEVHQQLAQYGRQIGDLTGKPLFLLSEYAECENPTGRRVPTGTQYTDQTGRYLMKMFGISKARHVTELPADDGSLLRPMLKSARRGWWYPDIPPPSRVLRADERATALLWHHDWIGNRFGGERISQLISFPLFKTLSVWQALGQWIPLLFMGTERYARTPWYYFSGHRDDSSRNNTSACYSNTGTPPFLNGGRFHEFAAEAHEAGLKDPLAFSKDGTSAGINWQFFRTQADKFGKPYMDHARPETFHASKLQWEVHDAAQAAVERLFETLLRARRDPRVYDDDPGNTQYKGWENNEHAFILRRRSPDARELLACFNLGDALATFRINPATIELRNAGSGYTVALDETHSEEEWSSAGQYSVWLDTNGIRYGGTNADVPDLFVITDTACRDYVVPPATAVVFSRDPQPPVSADASPEASELRR